jgi:hypothetical protein
MLKFFPIFLVFLFPNSSVAAEDVAKTDIVTPTNIKSTTVQPEQVESSDDSTNLISTAKDLSHIFFFITMGTIGYLSYRQAKKTVFSPIKTEIFKYQLGEFENVIGHFQNKNEHDLKSDLDMQTIIDINGSVLFKKYVETFFSGEIELDENYFKEKMKLAKGAIVSKEYAEKYFEIIGPETTNDLPAKIAEPTDPALKLAKWQEEKYGMVHYTENFDKAMTEIEKFQSSPLLPAELKTILEEYYQLIHETLATVGNAIEEAAIELPKVCSSKEQLDNFSSSWLSNIHNDKAPKLEPKAKEVLTYINKYLRIDELASDKV